MNFCGSQTFIHFCISHRFIVINNGIIVILHGAFVVKKVAFYTCYGIINLPAAFAKFNSHVIIIQCVFIIFEVIFCIGQIIVGEWVMPVDLNYLGVIAYGIFKIANIAIRIGAIKISLNKTGVELNHF
ncbi:hypothetical protein GALL_479010 [mine drainage metagenome]|uniref:Uncharacterized protein n=1 Tax=mine drainage metagenome TaxID=410659 RepID=A0A1J5Q3N8_9ZZZZ